jgi:hypothetical protein
VNQAKPFSISKKIVWEESMGQILHQLHAGGERGRDDQDAPRDAALGTARPQ